MDAAHELIRIRISAPRELVSFILPGYDLPGMGMVNCCLRFANHVNGHSSTQTASTLFFLSISALRLQKPLPIMIAGQFRLGEDNDLNEDPRLFRLTSAWQPKPTERYQAEDVTAASEIATRLYETREQKNIRGPNLEGAVVYFSQVTMGLVQSLQLASLGLWSSLEALFLPDGDKAKTLAKRISTFLSRFDFSIDLEEWVQSEYTRRRSAYAHGQHFAPPWKADTDPAPKAFGRLHEIARLCLLGFLGMNKQELLGLQNSKKGDVKRRLNDLPAASGPFLNGQGAWLG
jgi:hypothetical protein